MIAALCIQIELYTHVAAILKRFRSQGQLFIEDATLSRRCPVALLCTLFDARRSRKAAGAPKLGEAPWRYFFPKYYCRSAWSLDRNTMQTNSERVWLVRGDPHVHLVGRCFRLLILSPLNDNLSLSPYESSWTSSSAFRPTRKSELAILFIFLRSSKRSFTTTFQSNRTGSPRPAALPKTPIPQVSHDFATGFRHSFLAPYLPLTRRSSLSTGLFETHLAFRGGRTGCLSVATRARDPAVGRLAKEQLLECPTWRAGDQGYLAIGPWTVGIEMRSGPEVVLRKLLGGRYDRTW